MKNLLKIGILAYLLIAISSCANYKWNFVYNNEDLVREKICHPDTISETIVKDTLIPVLEIDSFLLAQLNASDVELMALTDSVQKLQLYGTKADSITIKLFASITKLKYANAELRKLATNKKIRVITKLKPYAVYQDKTSTLNDLINTQQKLAKFKTYVWALSFAFAFLLFILAVLFIRKK
jgi:hypothetical protein